LILKGGVMKAIKLLAILCVTLILPIVGCGGGGGGSTPPADPGNGVDIVGNIGSYGTVYYGTFPGASVSDKPPYTTSWRINIGYDGTVTGHTDNKFSGGSISGTYDSGTGALNAEVDGGYDVNNPIPLNGNTTLTGTVDASGNISGTWVVGTLANRQGTFTGTKESIPAHRFTIKANGTVYDSYTNLTWLKNANCFGVKSWSDATSATSVISTLKSGQCGLSDGSVAGNWRLPTTAEMVSYIDDGFISISLESLGFQNVQQLDYINYWTSDANLFNLNQAWSVNLYYGTLSHDDYTTSKYIWPVHSGQ
jgi:hypothetical protein